MKMTDAIRKVLEANAARWKLEEMHGRVLVRDASNGQLLFVVEVSADDEITNISPRCGDAAAQWMQIQRRVIELYGEM